MTKLKIITKPKIILNIDDKLLDTVENYIKTFDEETIINLINNDNNNNKTKLIFLGKGDEGTVYAYNELLAIKFFVLSDNKELEFMKKLKEYENINTLQLYRYFIKDNHLITIINKADGTIDKWMKNINNTNVDLQWYNMMVQILFGVLLIQKKLLMYHKDLLHRNILYKKLKEEIEIKYVINKFTITIYTDTIFFISDFGKSQSLLPEFKKYNILDDDIIQEKINTNADLEGISSIYKKIFVDYIYHNIQHDALYKMIENNKEAHEYLQEIEKKIFAKTQIISKPPHYVKLQVVRSLCYYLIEHNYIDIKQYNTKINIPSKKVRKILENLCNKKKIKYKLKKIHKKLEQYKYIR